MAAASTHPRQRAPRVVTTGLLALDGEQRVHTGDLVRLAGPSGLGKTQLLYALVAGTIAPAPAGRGACACYIELAECCDRARVAALVRDRVSRCDMGDIGVDAAMARLFVYRARNTAQLCVTMHSLLAYVATRGGAEGTWTGGENNEENEGTDATQSIL